jgi:2'-5' RNA ligase
VPTAVVSAAFDPATDAVVERLREGVEAAGHRVRRAHRPHLTLAAARVDDVETVAALTREIAARHAPIPLTMSGLGSFPSGVLFVATEALPELQELQRDAYDTLTARWPPAFGPQSEPASWVPHVTLATRLPRPALRRLREIPLEPYPATVDALAVIVVGGQGDAAYERLRG